MIVHCVYMSQLQYMTVGVEERLDVVDVGVQTVHPAALLVLDVDRVCEGGSVLPPRIPVHDKLVHWTTGVVLFRVQC